MRKACKRCTVECGNPYAVDSELCRGFKECQRTMYIPFLVFKACNSTTVGLLVTCISDANHQFRSLKSLAKSASGQNIVDYMNF